MDAPSDIRPACILTIAGSDSGGGAGIQADVKAIARCGAHGMTAITAITAQSTVGVRSVFPLPPEVVLDQVRAVVEDIGVDAVKIGMVGNSEAIVAVAQALDLTAGAPVVLDPVMVAESGARLLDEEAEDALRELLVPRAAVVTPNLAEAAALAGTGARSEFRQRPSPEAGSASRLPVRSGPTPVTGSDDPAEELAKRIHRLGSEAVVVTGGHATEVADVFYDGKRCERLTGERHFTDAAHGSGCTHSSTLAAGLGQGLEPLEAARRARWLASEAVRHGLSAIGAGAGPVDVLGILERAPRRAPRLA